MNKHTETSWPCNKYFVHNLCETDKHNKFNKRTMATQHVRWKHWWTGGARGSLQTATPLVHGAVPHRPEEHTACHPPFSSTDSSDSILTALRFYMPWVVCRRMSTTCMASASHLPHDRSLASQQQLHMLGQGPGIIFRSNNQTSPKLCRILGRWLIYLMLWGVWMAHRYQYWRRTIMSISISSASASMQWTYRLCVTHNWDSQK